MKGLPSMSDVTSSHVAQIGHDGQRLFVRFKGGGVYSYDGVPKDVFDAGIKADSPGRWFRSHVSGRYRHKKHDD